MRIFPWSDLLYFLQPCRQCWPPLFKADGVGGWVGGSVGGWVSWWPARGSFHNTAKLSLCLATRSRADFSCASISSHYVIKFQMFIHTNPCSIAKYWLAKLSITLWMKICHPISTPKDCMRQRNILWDEACKSPFLVCVCKMGFIVCVG